MQIARFRKLLAKVHKGSRVVWRERDGMGFGICAWLISVFSMLFRMVLEIHEQDRRHFTHTYIHTHTYI
jgi:hypothetical protein